MRILLVEDEPQIAVDVKTALEAEGYLVESVSDGEEAWFLGDTEEYDLIVLDLGLPTMDGLVVLKSWRNAGRQIPVLVLTARGTWAERVEGIDAGGDAHVINVPVIIREDAVLALHLGIKKQIKALIFAHGTRDFVGVDDEVEGAETLGHAKQFLAGFVHSPRVGGMKCRHHILVHGLETLTRDRFDEAFRIHHFTSPGIVQIDQIPDLGFPCPQPVDRVGIRCQAFSTNLGAKFTTERVKYIIRVVTFPTVDVEFLVTGSVGELG